MPTWRTHALEVWGFKRREAFGRGGDARSAVGYEVLGTGSCNRDPREREKASNITGQKFQEDRWLALVFAWDETWPIVVIVYTIPALDLNDDLNEDGER